MAIKAYMNFNGNCREAVDYYAKVFGDKSPRIMLFGDMPSGDGFPITEDTKNLVMHAEVKVLDTSIMFSDCPPGMPLTMGNNITLTIVSKDIEEIKSLFGKMKEGSKIMMDLQETFWSKCYGYLIDKFGIGWQLSYESEEAER